MQKLKPLIVALDVKNDDLALKYVDGLRHHVDIFKVGPYLFMRYGMRIIRRIQWRKKKIFLDLKFHDIPNTVESAVKAAADLGVYAVSVHLACGRP
ncbi:MAG: orotidine-5'-phosphate decarboxylase, partial [Elusimicrobia bacterium]|nr:orotidine-5'-phosphate decarboxylase [Elusimicrobiota bacterium]MBD3412766.1 orotidine-5'-phosphate decarboxylase [Elusimicrobiota bacterium]